MLWQAQEKFDIRYLLLDSAKWNYLYQLFL